MKSDAGMLPIKWLDRPGRPSTLGLLVVTCAVLLALTYYPPLAILRVATIAGILLVLARFPGLAVGVLAAAILANVPDIAATQYGWPFPGVFLVLAIGAILVGRALLGQESLTASIPFAAAAAAYVGFAALAVFWVDDVGATLASLKELMKALTIALVIFGLTTTPERFRTVGRVIAVTMSLIAGLACVQYFLGTFDQTFLGFATAYVKHIAGNVNSWRAAGPLHDPNFFAQTLVIAFPLVAVLATTDPKWTYRFIGLIGVPLIVAAVLITFSRGGLVGIGAVTIAGVLMVRHRSPIVAAALVLTAVAFTVEPAAFLDRMTSAIDAVQALLTGQDLVEDGSLNRRIGLIAVGLLMFLEHPILGIGIGQYSVLYQDYALKYGYDVLSPPEAHNRLVEVLAENGLLGFVIFLTICIASVFVATKGATALYVDGRRSEAAFVKASVAGFVGYLATSLFLHDAFPRFFWMQIALLTSTWRFLPVRVTDLEGRFVMDRKELDINPSVFYSRGKWIIVLFALIGAVIGAIAAQLTTPRYLAEASLFYRLGKEYFPETRNWADLEILDRAMSTEMRIIRNRTVRDAVVNAVGAEVITLGKQGAGANPNDSEAYDEAKKRASERLSEIVTIRRVAGAMIITVGAKHPVPQIAERIVSSTIDAYLVLRKNLFSPGGLSDFVGPISEAEARLNAIDLEIGTLRKMQGASVYGGVVNSGLSPQPAESRLNQNARQMDERRLKKLEVDRSSAIAYLDELIRARDLFSASRASFEAVSSKIEILEPPKAGREPIGVSQIGRIGLGLLVGAVIGGTFQLAFAVLARLRLRLAHSPPSPLTS